MNCEMYIGLDVHQATISIAVRDSAGKVVMDSFLETKASTSQHLGRDSHDNYKRLRCKGASEELELEA